MVGHVVGHRDHASKPGPQDECLESTQQRLTGAPPRMSELVPTVNRGDAVGIAYKGGPCPEDVLLAPVGVDDVGAPCARQGPQSAGNLQGTLARFVEDLDGDAFG